MAQEPSVRSQRLARELIERRQGFSHFAISPFESRGRSSRGRATAWRYCGDMGVTSTGLGVSGCSNLSEGAMTMSSSNCKRRILGAGAAFGALLVSMAAAANPVPWQMNLDKGVTSVSRQIWDLHMAALWVCVALGVLVFGAIIRFRRSKGAVAETWSHNTLLEIGWTVVPVLILIGLATPATILTREMYNATESQ